MRKKKQDGVCEGGVCTVDTGNRGEVSKRREEVGMV